jgi:antitoxin (DNA-binding transcriptional repressor) of toxin-antitoxin stability system
MRTIEISTASKPLCDYADELDEEIIVLTSNDQPVAAIVSLRKVDKEALSLSLNGEFIEIEIYKARQDFETGRRLSFDEMKQAVLERS